VSLVFLLCIVVGFILELTVKPHELGSLILLVGVLGNAVVVVAQFRRRRRAGL
jgi:hypothetical protein